MKDESPNGPNQRKSSNSSRHTILLAKTRPPKLSKIKCAFFSQKPPQTAPIFKCRPQGTQPQSLPTGSTIPSARSEAPVSMGRAPGRYSECPAPSQSKSQEHGPELSLLSESDGEPGGTRLQLSSIRRATKPQFLHLRTSMALTCSEKSNHQSAQ